MSETRQIPSDFQLMRDMRRAHRERHIKQQNRTMLRAAIVVALVGTFLILIAGLASAQERIAPLIRKMELPRVLWCGDHKGWVKGLEGPKYRETKRWSFLAGESQVYEVWTSAKETWSILRIATDGTTCLVASGVGILGALKPPIGDPS